MKETHVQKTISDDRPGIIQQLLERRLQCKPVHEHVSFVIEQERRRVQEIGQYEYQNVYYELTLLIPDLRGMMHKIT